MNLTSEYNNLLYLVSRAAWRLAASEDPDWVAHDLPWRIERTPFRIFLAEFLLIRTRADVVAVVFMEIVARYPDCESLAEANPVELQAILEPLGLIKRVPILTRAAKYISEQLGGKIPSNVEDLTKIPGIGAYTSRAIAAFAFGALDIPADVNVLRFLSRLTGLPMKHKTKGSRQLLNLLPGLRRDHGGPAPEVLIDFTRIICHPRAPQCERCPLVSMCCHRRSSLV